MAHTSPTNRALTAVTRRTVTIAVTSTTVHAMTPKMWEALAKLDTQPLNLTARAWSVGTWGRTSTLCSKLVRAGLAEYDGNVCLINEIGRAALAQQLAKRQPAAR
ncbi:hypothetical protein ACFV2Q_19880 [Streptomyces sp. NPDC059650]|uniref:hypothetical protein n=1 Tax=Streptomyces sp. NPDC059650 TaxID=3346896 RepID=UPI003695B7A7